MYKTTKALFMICETSLHAGSGEDLGVVDLPIQRERHTSFPKIEGSTLKGAIRNAFERKDLQNVNYQAEIHQVFGYDDAFEKQKASDIADKIKDQFKDAKEFAGCLSVSDARLLLFPVKSVKGVFAWVTCPQVLQRLQRDLTHLPNEGIGLKEVLKDLKDPQPHTCWVAQNSNVTLGNDNDKVVLEEYTFEAKTAEWVQALAKLLQEQVLKDTYQGETLVSKLVILTDDDFKDFVNLSTEVVTRNKINNVTGTVDNGALFTEEHLPAESILYNLLLIGAEFKQNGLSEGYVQEFVKEHLPEFIQVGGNASLGKGIIRTQFWESVVSEHAEHQLTN